MPKKPRTRKQATALKCPRCGNASGVIERPNNTHECINCHIMF